MIPRLLNLPKNKSFFLFGARGTGKSSLLKAVFSDEKALYFDLLEPLLADLLLVSPEKLSGKIIPFLENSRSTDAQTTPWIVIDEIQKNPKLLDQVQKLITERHTNFALTGSSARKLKRGSANLLAGRAYIFTLFPFTHTEIGSSFDLDRALSYGTLPESWLAESDLDRRRYLKSYALTYLKEEIVAEQVVRNLAPFRRFLSVAAACNTEIVNYTNISKDILSDPKTVQAYYEILEDTLLGFMLQCHSFSIRKRQRSSPKFYLFDTGVVRALTDCVDAPLQSQSFEYGQLFESFIVNEVYRLLTYKEEQFRLSYIRVDNSLEIDLIIERASKPTILCEIKSSNKVDSRHCSSLIRIGSDFPDGIRLLISKDLNEYDFNGVRALHWMKALETICSL
jgi:predicted AAA+ superfamily ATPase